METKFSKVIISTITVILLLVSTNGCDTENNENQAPIVTTYEITSITAISAQSGGIITADGGSAVTSRGVCWSVSTNPTVDDNKTVNGAGAGSFTSNLIDLEPNTTYFVRAYATNSFGTGYGMAMSFNTLDGLSNITTTEVSSITATTAISGGNITDDGGATITSRGVVWGITQNPTLQSNEGFSTDGEGIGQYVSNLINLNPSTQYYVRAYSTSAAGTSYGNQLSFNSRDGIVSITTNPITNIQVNSAISGGTITDDGGAEVSARGIVWSTSQNPTVETNQGLTNNGNGLGSYSSALTSLSSGVYYYVRAYATNNVGTTYGNQLSFTTLNDGATGTVTDVDGNVYETVLIGNKEWMAQDLKTTKYRNGSAIARVDDNTIWQNTFSGAYSPFNHVYADGLNSESEVIEAYGLLYNWYAAVDTRGICPTGWRVPTDTDWSELTDYLIEAYAGLIANNVGNALKSCRQISSPLGGECNTTVHPRWAYHSVQYGINDFSFSSVPSGYRGWSGLFDNIGNGTYYWSSTEYSTINAWQRGIAYNYGTVYRNNYDKRGGNPIRCVKNID